MATLFTLVSLVALSTASCGSAHTSAVPVQAGSATVTPAPSATATAPSTSPSPSSPGTGVVPGGPGPSVPSQAECSGWPASSPSGPLPASFTPVSVLRCVTGDTDVPGKGEWVTVTLERADTGLAPLANALRQPDAVKEPGQICPDYVVLAPQIVLVSADGAKLRPRLPVDSCGKIQPQVLSALAGLRWQSVSQRLISQVPAPSNT